MRLVIHFVSEIVSLALAILIAFGIYQVLAAIAAAVN
jgi:hypothetical protein